MAALCKIPVGVVLLPHLLALCDGIRLKVASSTQSASEEQSASACEMSAPGKCKVYASAGSHPSCAGLAGTYYWKVPSASNTFRVMPKKYSSYTPGLNEGIIIEQSKVPSYSQNNYPEEFLKHVGSKMVPHPEPSQYFQNFLIPGWENSSTVLTDTAECMRIVCMGLETAKVGPTLTELLKMGGGQGNLHAGKIGSSASGGWVVTEETTGALVACQYQDESPKGTRPDDKLLKGIMTVRGPLVDAWTFADDAGGSPATDILAPVALRVRVGATMGMGNGIDEVWQSSLTCVDGNWEVSSFEYLFTGGGSSSGRTYDDEAQRLILPHIPKSLNGLGEEEVRAYTSV
mmetsp:Transcript_82231/g.129448  ORF Transcript_82231/g.129448 Transcript_82231/m.129448 type:complete len:345 (+) Transcript_82231:49-1083(+)|eukprot:CAMPEP_0169078488 /NCGR_PEP_ID=MMETSP1015-20121227/9437_1 /TAXON_ID=342587 /ORGANISM="Karlodinium micrum, Strain CCMP2283" /LENGTH=344 /DNA_ID=CAMNT_0009138079 /DNA_START=48 /DNA_END=1082 /DNA_ORIENTATION=-